MTKFFLLVVLLLSGMLCLTGCGGSDSNDSAAAPAADPGDAVGDPPVDAATAADQAFADTTPSGIKQTDKFNIVGRGTSLAVACNAISGATSYTFTTSFGASENSATPSTAFLATTAQGDASYTLSVYATNGNGIQTKTGSASVN